MLQLYIDGRPVTIKQGTSIRLTRENPFMTQSGDYTLDVTLPLAGCPDNLAVFGPIHRPESSALPLAGHTYPMQLIDGVVNLDGTAIIQSVTQDEVKLQLTAGMSGLRHALDGTDKQYITDLDLGRAWDELPAFILDEGGYEEIDTPRMAAILFHSHDNITGSDGRTYSTHTIRFGNYRQTSALCLPLYSTSDDVLTNKSYFREVGTSGQKFYALMGRPTDSGYIYATVTPMPYLYQVVRRVVEAFGYRLDDSHLPQGHPFYHIFIVSAASTLDIAKMLPKWTPQELLRHIENLLGVNFNTDGDTVFLRSNADTAPGGWYSQTIALHDVTDDTTTDIEKDETDAGDTSRTGNVDYQWDDIDAAVRLPDEVFESAEVLHMKDYNEIAAHFAALRPADRARSNYLYIDDRTGRRFAILHTDDEQRVYELCRVDQFAPLLRDPSTRDIGTELTLVPAACVLQSASNEGTGVQAPNFSFDIEKGIPTLATPDTVVNQLNEYSVDLAINAPEDTSAGTDTRNTTDDIPSRLLIGYYTEDIYALDDTGRHIPVAIGQPYVRHPQSHYPAIPGNLHGTPQPFISPDFFVLNHTSGDYSIAAALQSGPNVDTRILHTFATTDARAIDPTAVYIIRGRRYICQKIEITIDQDGIQPLKKLYLCELLD